MKNISRIDGHVGELLSGYIDGELTQQDAQQVRLHCDSCPECGQQLKELEAMRAQMGESRLSNLDQDTWRENMNDLTVTAPRSLGWLLFIGGVLIAAGLALYEFVTNANSLSPTAMLIVGGIYGGLLLLFVSVLRQRLIERKTAKYKDVEI